MYSEIFPYIYYTPSPTVDKMSIHSTNIKELKIGFNDFIIFFTYINNTLQ